MHTQDVKVVMRSRPCRDSPRGKQKNYFILPPMIKFGNFEFILRKSRAPIEEGEVKNYGGTISLQGTIFLQLPCRT